MNDYKSYGLAIVFCFFTAISFSAYAHQQGVDLNNESSQQHAYPQPKSSLSAEETEACKETLNVLLTQVYPILSMLCEHIALIINNNQLRISNKKEVLAKIIEYRTFFNAVLSGQVVPPSPENVYLLILFAEHATASLRKAIKSNLQDFPTLNPQLIMTKRSLRGTTPNIANLHEATTILSRNVKRLHKQADAVGLSWVNKTFRTLEKLNNRYNILSKVAWTAGIGAGAALLFFLLDENFFKTKASASASGLNNQPAPSTPDSMTLVKGNDTLTLPTQQILAMGNELAQQGWQPVNYPAKPEQVPSSVPAYAHQVALPAGAPDSLSHQIWDTFAKWKGVVGGPADPKMGLLGVENPTIFTRLHHFSRNFVDWSVPKIAVGAWIGYRIGASWNDISNWASLKMTQIASYLRGTPVQKIAEGIYLKEPDVTFDDLIGNEHNKAELELIYNYLIDYENFDRAGLIPETGYLFSGPPRTGKTHMAAALAGSVKKALLEKGSIEQLRFVTLTPAAFKSLGVQPGESRTEGIKNVLLGARDFAPVVIFIDEFDLGGWQRERDTEALGELLDAMSTLNKDKVRKVVVIAATNSPNTIDIALRSPGRFGKTLFFTVPSLEERFEFLHRELTKRAVIITEEFAQYILQIARETEGSSYDALTRLVITALIRARVRQSSLEPADLEMALDQVIRQLQPALLDTMSDEEQKIISAHLAGHTIARIALKARDVVTKVTICPISPKVKEEMILAKYEKKDKNNSDNIDKGPDFRYGKVFTLRSEQDKFSSHEDIIIKAKIKLAGHIAENMLRGNCSYSYHQDDEQKAFAIAQQITWSGMKPENMSKAMYQEKLNQAHTLFATWQHEVQSLLEQHKDALELLSLALFNHKIVPVGIIATIMEEPHNEQLKAFLSKTQQELIEELMKAQEAEQSPKTKSENSAANEEIDDQNVHNEHSEQQTDPALA